MTKEHEASRTLVKSPPELWAECSDAGSLARHLGEFGEITITRLEPETTVAWEGEHASGTVQIEPSGWGTRVTLRAQTSWEEPEAPLPEPAAEAEAEAESEIEARSVEPEVQPVEETEHAEMEEAVEDPEDGSLEDTGRARARWRRITARMRRAFTGREPEEAPDGEAEDTEDPEELMGSPSPIEDQVELEAESEVEAKADAVLPAAPELETGPQPEAGPEPERLEPAAPGLDADAILTSALESLGQAHHRPFSRA